MQALIDQALFAPTLPFTVLLAALAIYWIGAAFGFVFSEDEMFDASDTDGAWASFLSFLNVGEVPVMIVITVLTLSTWVLSILGNEFLAGGSLALGFVLLVPAFAVGCVITRFTTAPFKKVLCLLNNEGEAPMQLIGKVAKVTTASVTDRYGQAAVETGGAPVIVQVRVAAGESLARGDSALIVAENAATGTFTVRKVSNQQLEN